MEKPRWTKTADDAVKEMGEDVSPEVRSAIEKLYGKKIQLELERLVDEYNEEVDLYNEQCRILDERDERRAAIRESIREIRESQLAMEKELDRINDNLEKMMKSPLYR
jgi:hypothetical protein